MSVHQFSISRSYLQHVQGEVIEMQVALRSDPILAEPKARGFNFSPPRYSFRAKSSFGPVRVITEDLSVGELLPGQKISGSFLVLESREGRVAALLIAQGSITVVTPASRWADGLASIRNGLSQASGDGDSGALIPGMVLGDTRNQSADFKGEMRRAGLTHLVAVSGANFAIVSAFVLWCMRFIFTSLTARLWATAIALASFIALVRPSPSVLRAAAMAAVMLVAMRTHQRRESLPALGFAIAAVIFIDPWQSRDPGFALSVLATLGLLVIAPTVIEWSGKWLPRWLASALAPPIAALALCLPVIVALSGFVSLSAVLANLCAAPFVAPITVIGFIAALISPFSPALAEILLLIVRPFAFAIVAIADWSSRIPVLTLQEGVVGSIMVILAIAILLIFRRKGAIVMLLLIFATLWINRFPADDWQVVACDVGQGDATVINLGNHRAIVIDVGPEPELIDQCLRRLDISTIALLILTHPHADHVGGLIGAEKNRTVQAQWYGNVAAGSRATIGPYTIDLLWPATAGFDDPNPNNVSIAALIRSKDMSIFASGDIEPEVQEQLRGKVGRVDIYKVAHHGSRFQDPTLMRELSPQVALISVGESNTYGHPAQSTISSLERLGAQVFRTDLHGNIAVSARGHRVAVDFSRSRWQWIGLN